MTKEMGPYKRECCPRFQNLDVYLVTPFLSLVKRHGY